MNKHIFIFLLLTFLLVGSVSGVLFNNDKLPGLEDSVSQNIIIEINETQFNVNNSDYLDGMDSTAFCWQNGNCNITNLKIGDTTLNETSSAHLKISNVGGQIDLDTDEVHVINLHMTGNLLSDFNAGYRNITNVKRIEASNICYSNGVNCTNQWVNDSLYVYERDTSKSLWLDNSTEYGTNDITVLEWGTDVDGGYIDGFPQGLYWSNYDTGDGVLRFSTRGGVLMPFQMGTLYAESIIASGYIYGLGNYLTGVPTYNVSYHGSLNNASYLSTYNTTYHNVATQVYTAITNNVTNAITELNKSSLVRNNQSNNMNNLTMHNLFNINASKGRFGSTNMRNNGTVIIQGTVSETPLKLIRSDSAPQKVWWMGLYTEGQENGVAAGGFDNYAVGRFDKMVLGVANRGYGVFGNYPSVPLSLYSATSSILTLHGDSSGTTASTVDKRNMIQFMMTSAGSLIVYFGTRYYNTTDTPTSNTISYNYYNEFATANNPIMQLFVNSGMAQNKKGQILFNTYEQFHPYNQYTYRSWDSTMINNTVWQDHNNATIAYLNSSGTMYLKEGLKLERRTLHACNGVTNGTFESNSTKLYFCDGTTWNALY